jgi:hypothetical protein
MSWHDLGVIAALAIALVWVYVFEAESRTDHNQGDLSG